MVSATYLTNRPNQHFSITIPGDTRNLSLNVTLSYNGQARYWVLGLYDIAKRPLVVGLPLTPDHDLLSAYKHLGLGSVVLANIGTGGATSEPPDDTNLDKFALLWELI
jgi:hypothetical protein